MKSTTAEIAEHIGREVTTLATCFTLTRRDGKVFGFTNHDQQLDFDAVEYFAHTGFVPSATEYSDNLSVDNMEIEALFDDPRLTDAEIRAGLFDYATVEYFQIDWLRPQDGKNTLKIGTIGEITRQQNTFAAEVRGPSQIFQQVIGEVLTPTCRAALGDARCKVDLPAITVTGTVTTPGAAVRRGFTDSARAEAVGLFDYGLLTWTAGDNLDVQMEVKRYTAGGVFDLFLEVPYPIAIGDEYTVYPGCDKQFSTCAAKFDNVVNFRGEPNLVGTDELYKFGGQ